MKNKVRLMAVSATIATTMLLQVLMPSVALAAKMASDEADTEITVETSAETSESSEDTSSVDVVEPSDASADYTIVEETEDLTETQATEPSSDETDVISSATDADPTDETLVETEETEGTEEYEEIEYVVFDHYYSEINANAVNTTELFVITSDASVFTRNTNVVSNYDNAYIIECSSVDEARFVYSYYVGKVDFITDMSDVASVANDETEVSDVPETEVDETIAETEETVFETEPTTTEEPTAETTVAPVEQEPDVADLSDLNNGSDAIANLNGIDTVHNDYSGYIAVIDTGANAHANFTVLGGDTFDHNGHGTSMFGYIRSENPNAQVVSIKVSEDGTATAADIYAGFRLAIDLNVSVINFSMTAPNIEKNAVIRDIIQEALDSGIVVIGAAGNNAISATNFIPGCIDGVITIGAVDADGNKIARSNYNADYYVVADSTSEATARYTGLYTAGLAGISIKVFDQVEEDDDYVPDDYAWASEVAEELTNRLQAEHGYGYVTFEIDEDGNVWFVYHYEGQSGDDFIVADWDPVATGAILELDHDVSYTVSGTSFSGTCDFTSTDGGKGVASNFSGTLGAWLRAAGVSSLTMICSKNFGEEDSNHALTLPTGTMNYVASYEEGQWTIMIGERAQAGQPVWTQVTDTVSYSVEQSGSYLKVTVGGTTRYVDLTTQSASDAITEVQDLVRQMTIVGEYNGNKGPCSVTVPATSEGTHRATRVYWHTDDTQTYEGQIRWPHENPHGSVTFRKVNDSQEYLSDAVISFTCISGEGMGHTSDLEIINPDTVASSSRITNGIQFTTNGSVVTIDGLYPNSTYVFHEVTAPTNPYTGLPYDLAGDEVVTTDANGNVPGTGITMVDGTSQSLYGSFALNKVFEAGIDGSTTGPNSFFNTVNALNFRMQGPFTEDYIENNPQNLDPHNGNTMYGAEEFASSSDWNGNSRGITWNSSLNRYEFRVTWTLHGEGAFPGIDIDYHKYYDDSEYGGGAWYDWPAGGASYMVGLPRNSYFLVTENWHSGMMSDEANQMLIDSANQSPYWVELPTSDPTYHLYAALYYIADNGRTYLCSWEPDEDVGMINRTAQMLPLDGGHSVSIWQDHFYGSVSNTARAGALQLEKIDETGNGVDGVRFELHRAGTGSGYVLARGVPNTSASTVDTQGVSHYPVTWTFTNTTYDDHRYWYEYVDEYGNPDPKIVGWDPVTGPIYEYGEVRGQWEYSEHQITADMVYNLNYGDYYIYEFIEDSQGNSIISNYRIPDGWLAWDEDTNRQWHEGDAGEPEYFYKLVTVDSNSHMAPSQFSITNREYAIHVEVAKVDAETNAAILTGATYELYYDVNGNDVIDAGVDILVGTEVTDSTTGVATFHYRIADLPSGVPTDASLYTAGNVNHFLARESVAPTGYYLNSQTMIATLVGATGFRATFTNPDIKVIELSFGIDKYDEWTDSILNGYDGPYDATFELYVDVNVNGEIDSADRLLDTLADTDHDGRIDVTYTLTPDVIMANFPECIDANGNITGESALNYPTHYLVRETVAPYDFYLNESVYTIVLNGGQYRETATRRAIDDTPYHTHMLVFKLDGDTGENIANAVFTIYNDVDGNGVYTEGVDTPAQTYTEAEGLHNAQVVWNQTEGCYVTSELRSGRYIVVETSLPNGFFYVDANGQPTLARNEALVVIERQDTSVADFEPVIYERTFYNVKPSIQTMFHDPVTMSQTAHVDDDIELIDTVSYTNLVPNVEVRLDAVVMVKSTGEPLLDANGNQVTGYRVFTPSTPNGTIDVSIHLDTNYVMSLVENGTLSAPVDLVCYETLSFTATTDVTPYHQWYDENPIAEHKEIDDLGQTVRVAEIRTGIYDNQTLSQVASDGPNGDGYAVLIDHVHYEGLAPGHTYTMRGEMHLLAYDDNGNPIDGGVLEGADAREILHPKTTFTPTEQEGYVDVTYVINANRFRGETTVSYEYCEDNGRTIVFHNDIEDLPQTVFFPNVHTNAYCPDTTPGEMGRTVIGLQQRARIVDEVSYENLLVDGRQYMIQGCLYWMYTDENGTIHSGPMADIIGEAQAMSTIFFTPTEQDGTIEMTFTFDSTVLADLHYDRLVVCESIFANGGIGWKRIANHWDFRYENNSQSIYVPDVHTTAFTEVGTTLPEGQMTDVQTRIVTDRVYYENLIPNTEYTCVGNVQYAMVDENGNISEWGDLVQNGQAVTGQTTFIPTSSSGYVDVTFTVNVSDIMAKGYDKLVCFESVYSSPGILCAIHADITDNEQDIDIPELHTTALGANGRHNVQATANTVIVDRISYSGLTPGRTYRMETDLMSSKTHESIAHVTTLFTPTESSGVLEVSITADLSGYTAGDYVVVFEDCYDNETGILIKSHHDWNDTDQTVETGGGGDTGIMDSSGEGYLVASAGCIVTMIGLGVSEIIKKRKKNSEVDPSGNTEA